MEETSGLRNLEDQPILGPDSTPQAFYHVEKRNGYQISHRDFFVLSLHLSGSTAEEIAELAGYASVGTVYNILHKKEVVLVRQQLLAGLELEFEALQGQIFQTIKEKLNSADERVQLESVNIWMKFFGRFTPKLDRDQQLTAEDVVRQILNQQININVNVGKDEFRGSSEPLK